VAFDWVLRDFIKESVDPWIRSQIGL